MCILTGTQSKSQSNSIKANQGEVRQDDYCDLLLFTILLLGLRTGLSDYCEAELVNDLLSASAFCNLASEVDAPDHNILARFRTQISKCMAFSPLLININNQLE